MKPDAYQIYVWEKEIRAHHPEPKKENSMSKIKFLDCSPQFKHDCEGCTFLGITKVPSDIGKDADVSVDLYLCRTHKDPSFWSFLYRFSDKPSDNISGYNPLFFTKHIPFPWEALIVERAKELGVWRES